MMSSPPQLQQPLGLSQYQNMLNESPVKPASYYFQNEGNNNNDGLNFQDENYKPHQLNLDPEISRQFLYSNRDDGSDDDENNQNNNSFNDENNSDSNNFIVPASQNDGNNSHFLQFPPKFDANSTSTNQYNQQQQQHSHALKNHQGPYLHSFQHNSNVQANLYPPMEFIPNSHSNNSINQIPESTSTNTMSSFDSMPLLTSSLVSSSVSDNSIASPISFQNHSTVTPRRPNRRPSFSVTPLPSIYQTPAQPGSTTSPIALKNGITPTTTTTTRRPRHRRTRSRLSLDANGAASIITINPSNSNNNIKSPAVQLNNGGNNGYNMGTNPFYTPPAFLSPHQGSPATTPLATPSIKKEHSNSNFESISPSMLMNAGLHGQNGADDDENNEPNDSVFIAAADLTMKLASKLATQSSNETNFLCDPLNAEFTVFNPSKSLSQDHPQQQQQQQLPEQKSFQPHHKPNISRSQSSINLASMASPHHHHQPHTTTNPNDPYQVKHYDILQPRKKIQKSNSTTNINDSLNGKKPKKVHSCPLCNAVFQRPEHVKRHMRSHSSEKPYECDEPGCGKRFNRGDNLKAHLRKIHHRAI